MLVVAEIFGHRKRREAHAKTAARRFVHLPEDHHHVWQYARRFHVTVKFFAFAASLTYPAKYTHALLVLDHVVNHFGEQYRLAHARPAEQSRLAATFERHEHIDDFDPCLKDLGFSGSAR